MSEHSLDDPSGLEVSPGEHEADDTVESEDTGARYHPDGTLASTPEDEILLAGDEDDEA